MIRPSPTDPVEDCPTCDYPTTLDGRGLSPGGSVLDIDPLGMSKVVQEWRCRCCGHRCMHSVMFRTRTDLGPRRMEYYDVEHSCEDIPPEMQEVQKRIGRLREQVRHLKRVKL